MLDVQGTDLICARHARPALATRAEIHRASVRWTPPHALALPRGLEVIADEEWEELDFGDWDGQPLQALPMQALQAFHLDPHANPPPHGESWGHFERRIARGIASVAG